MTESDDWPRGATDGPARPRARRRGRRGPEPVAAAAPGDLLAVAQRLVELEARVARLENAHADEAAEPPVDLDTVVGAPTDAVDEGSAELFVDEPVDGLAVDEPVELGSEADDESAADTDLEAALADAEADDAELDAADDAALGYGEPSEGSLVAGADESRWARPADGASPEAALPADEAAAELAGDAELEGWDGEEDLTGAAWGADDRAADEDTVAEDDEPDEPDDADEPDEAGVGSAAPRFRSALERLRTR